ncbi:hypothetical protein [Bradyrhizobium sp. LB11.1]|uniref:hypothetical protein n=1 Tax=Bradyrhizobium sp. LB11.1 TaxID=3156326 RepID=UPI003398FDD9
MTVLATAVLLASSLAFPSPGHVGAADVEPNLMLRYAAVDHDLVKVKRRIMRALHSDATDGTQLFAAPSAVR